MPLNFQNVLIGRAAGNRTPATGPPALRTTIIRQPVYFYYKRFAKKKPVHYRAFLKFTLLNMQLLSASDKILSNIAYKKQ